MARLRLGRGKGRAEELVVPEAGARPPPTREEQRRAAKKRLARAEAELERLEGKERRADRRIAARDRTVDRRLRRIESARGRRVWPLVAAIVALNAVASGLAVIHMFWPDLLLGEGVLVPDAGQWEFVAYLFIVCALASLAFIAYHPLAELHRRVRLAMSMYVSMALIASTFGMLLATFLQPVEDLDIDHVSIAWKLSLVALAGAAAVAILYMVSGLRGSRLASTLGYHVAMGVLLAVVAGAMVLLLIFIVPAIDRVGYNHLEAESPLAGGVYSPMTIAGLGLTLVGAIGMLFALPALAGAMAAEFLLGRREAVDLR